MTAFQNSEQELNPAQIKRLQQFLAWIIPCNLGFALLEASAAAYFQNLPTALAALVLGAGSGILFKAREQVNAGRVQEAVTTVFAALLLASCLVMLLQPYLRPTLVFIPLLAVALVLPYVGGRRLRIFFFAAWVTTSIIILLGTLLPNDVGLPGWFLDIFSVTSLIATVGLILLLLWQFSSRLRDTLAQTQEAEERYSLAARGANDGLWDWHLESGYVYYSPRWKAMLGYAEDEIGDHIGEWIDRVHPGDRERVKAELAVHRDGLTPHFESEHRLLARSGRYQWVLTRGLAVRDDKGKVVRISGSQTDITRRKQVEEQLLHEAYHDTLTGLPNRARFLDHLGQAVARAKRDPSYRFAVLFLDLDRFKVVNDSLGHLVGDNLLVAVARRLRGVIRPSDMIARLGGDEFTIFLDSIVDTADATTVATRIEQALRAPFSLDAHEAEVSASIGIAINARHHLRAEEVLRDADIALYQAKKLGKAQHAVFDQAMQVSAMARLQLEMDLRRALRQEELVVQYQPVIALEDRRLTGFEALVRWEHPQRGLISPLDFIPLAEESGMIVPLTWYVIRTAFAQLREWQERLPAVVPITMSVNISGIMFSQSDLVEQFRQLMEQYGIYGEQLCIEITEGAMMQNADLTRATLLELRNLNLQIHMDDFGTGYSSLSLLHHFPIDALKIDREFVKHISSQRKDEELVSTIVTLAHDMKLEVIAEGIETVEQERYLRKLGCRFGQGYLFARPMDGRQALNLITAMQNRPLEVSCHSARTGSLLPVHRNGHTRGR